MYSSGTRLLILAVLPPVMEGRLGAATTASAYPPTPSIQEGLGSKGQWGKGRDLDLHCLKDTAGPAPAAGDEGHG